MRACIQLPMVLATLLLGALPCSVASQIMVDHGDGTVTDQSTGLMWLKQSFPQAGGSAKTWVDAMLWADGLTFATHTDWRLPSALDVNTGVPDLVWNSGNNEWGHLYGITWGSPANGAAIAPMVGYPCCWYWTSTEHPGNTAQAAAFFVSYDGLWLNQLYAKATTMRYTAVRGVRVAQKAPQCRDGYDNDANGTADYPADVGCSNADDATEWTCRSWLGIRCVLSAKNPWWQVCFHIEDSTICVTWIAMIAVVFAGLWWYLRRKRAEA